MPGFILYDGQLLPEASLLVGGGNRGFRYGEGVFETLRMDAGKLPLWEYHAERLFAGLRLLEFENPDGFSATGLRENIFRLANSNGHANSARIRLMVFRGDGGWNEPVSSFPHCLIQSTVLPDAKKVFNEKGLSLGIHEASRKAIDVLANCKTNNFLPYIMASLEARRNDWAEAVVLNAVGRVCDTTSANIFLLSRGTLITPPLTEGPIAGVMRRYLIAQCRATGITVMEEPVTTDLLNAAEEIFLTNAVSGIRPVTRFLGRDLETGYSRRLFEQFISPLF